MNEPLLRSLDTLSGTDAAIVGVKAANLGRLLAAGFPVPRGFVLTVDALSSSSLAGLVARIASELGGVAVAVRSSGAAEDLPGASFAGQYDTVLDVRGADAILCAVERCRRSAESARVHEYAPGRGQGDPRRIAVLVQELVRADAAGVCFTANPVTGARAETVVSAVRGLGERLVSGRAVADEWIVEGGVARCTASPEGAIREDDVVAIAALARRVERHFGSPQDVEWALAGGRVHLLQARPMTALPDEVAWKAPNGVGWLRNFRLGEHLTEPLTPLFASWAIDRLEEGFYAGADRDLGQPAPKRPWHVVVNGWYYNSYSGSGGVALYSLRWILRSPRRFWPFVRAYYGQLRHIDAVTMPFHREWRETLLPRYRALVEEGVRALGAASTPERIDIVDRILHLAGEHFWKAVAVGGWSWKCEALLGALFEKRLADRIDAPYAALLCGLDDPRPLPPYAVHTLDWHRPTMGEIGIVGAAADPDRRAASTKERLRVEAACRAVLADSPKDLARFESLLALARRFIPIRDEMVEGLTIGWPLLRRALLAMGEDLARRGVVGAPEDVFFLERAELEATESLAHQVDERRRTWERQRRLAAPLTLGTPPFVPYDGRKGKRSAIPEGAIGGMPASPGRATGPARLVHGPDDFGRLAPGDVLVAPATTPAFTPLFARAAAVVTDGGSMTAHASLVAREYGIPAVVATGHVTRRIRDGQIVTVDGTAGFVEPR